MMIITTKFGAHDYGIYSSNLIPYGRIAFKSLCIK